MSFKIKGGNVMVYQIINSKEQEISFRIESKKDADRIYSWLDEPVEEALCRIL